MSASPYASAAIASEATGNSPAAGSRARVNNAVPATPTATPHAVPTDSSRTNSHAMSPSP